MPTPRPLDVLIVEPLLDPDLPLSLYERLRTAMKIRTVPHGAQAMRLIEAGDDPDIVVVDRRAPGIDLGAMQRLLQRRADRDETAISFIDAERAMIHVGDAAGPLALLHDLSTLHRLQDDDAC